MEKNGNMQNTWIEEFYNETNADNRLRILNDNKDNSELDSFREKFRRRRVGERQMPETVMDCKIWKKET